MMEKTPRALITTQLRFSTAAYLSVCIFIVASVSGCPSVPASFCAKADECAEDPPGDDFPAICTVQVQGDLDALRANDEEECHEVAEAKEILMACLTNLTCGDLNDVDYGGECEDERDDYLDAFSDADDELGSVTLGFGGSAGVGAGRPLKCSSWD